MATQINPAESSLEPADETPLCLSCMVPNRTEAHFCENCGAPMSSYASTGPFESLFAEGFMYRQAAEAPRRFIVVLGIWLIFLPAGLLGLLFIPGFRAGDFGASVVGGTTSALSLLIIAKTTWNYFKNRVPKAATMSEVAPG